MTHTKDKLAAALRKVGLTEMADQAEKGHYHDFLSPLDTPELVLVAMLMDAALKYPDKAKEITRLRNRVIRGDFDATLEESEAWAQSPEGLLAFSRLMGGK
jgi:hypothetical protein